MAAGGLIKVAGKLLSPALLKKLGGLRGLNQLKNDAAISGLYSGGMTAYGQIASGENINIPEILTYGLADTLTGGLAAGGVRALRGARGIKMVKGKNPRTGKTVTTKEVQRSGFETPANIVASVVTPMAVSNALSKQEVKQATPLVQSQQQIQQQQLQQLPGPMAGAYMPFVNLTNQQQQASPLVDLMVAPGFQNDPNFEKNAMAIMGL